jgi:hypothetical protein
MVVTVASAVIALVDWVVSSRRKRRATSRSQATRGEPGWES